MPPKKTSKTAGMKVRTFQNGTVMVTDDGVGYMATLRDDGGIRMEKDDEGEGAEIRITHADSCNCKGFTYRRTCKHLGWFAEVKAACAKAKEMTCRKA